MTVAELVSVVGALLEALKPFVGIVAIFTTLIRDILGALGV
jgi:hypothetical protein